MRNLERFSGNVISKSEMKSIEGGNVPVDVEVVFGLFQNCMFLQEAYNQASNSGDRDAILKQATSLNCPGTNGRD